MLALHTNPFISPSPNGKYPWYLFVMEVASTPGHNVAGRIRSMIKVEPCFNENGIREL